VKVSLLAIILLKVPQRCALRIWGGYYFCQRYATVALVDSIANA